MSTSDQSAPWARLAHATALLDGSFDVATIARGLKLHMEGAVLWYDHDTVEHAIEAGVQGTRASPYELTVYLDRNDDVVDAVCSCPVGNDCKHCVAAFLAFHSDSFERPGPSVDLSSGEPLDDLEPPDWHAPGGRPNRDPQDHRRSGHAPPDAAVARRLPLDSWLRRFEDASVLDDTRQASSGRADDNPRRRLYLLDPCRRRDDGHVDIDAGVELTIREASRTKAGHFQQGRRVSPDRYGSLSYDTKIERVDEEIASCGTALARRLNDYWHDDDGCYTLAGRLGATMLELALESGRTFIGTDRHRSVARGPDRPLIVEWRDGPDETLTLSLRLEDLERWSALATDPPMYLDTTSGQVGRLDTAMNGAQLMLALDSPSVPETELQYFGEALDDIEAAMTRPARPEDEAAALRTDTADGTSAEAAPEARLIPLPAPLEDRVTATPVPVLLLYSPDEDAHVDTWQLVLMIRYEEFLVSCDRHAERLAHVTRSDGRRVRVQRDLETERRWFDEVTTRFDDLTPHYRETDASAVGTTEFRPRAQAAAGRFRAYRRVVAARLELERDGWELIVLPPVHTDVVRPSRFEAIVAPDEDATGWFDVSLGFEHDGVHHDLVPLVVDWLARGGGDEPLLVEHADGRFLEVPAAALQPVAAVLGELGEHTGDRDTIRLSRARALALDTLRQALDDGDIDTDWHGERELIDFAGQLKALGDVDTSGFADTPVPRALRATLRPYQRAGLGWLNTLARHDLCGILADDMGLGKTVQTLAHLLWLRSARRLDGPALVVAPTSLLGNWAREAAQFAPRLHVRVWHGADRHERPLARDDRDTRPADLVVTSYGLVLRDRDMLAEHGFGLLVLDEAQQIRNPATKVTRAVKSLPVARRLCLSGTPLENHLGELWSQFDFLMPGLLGDTARFARHYRTPIERHGDQERLARLAAAVRPFMLRRRKEEVATELPAKTEIVRDVSLNDAQAKLYESIRVAMQARVRDALQSRGLAQSRITVLDSLLKLRQLCCHPQLVKLPSARKVHDSAKTDAALDMITEMVGEGRRILVFSQFTSMLTILERELTTRGLASVKLTGQTRKRDEAIDRFQRGEVPLFLISLKAGGTGLNLTAADTVIHYDPWWNPAAEDQASARAHRIGQDKPVFVYRLVTSGTVEEKIVALQARKRKLADAMLERGDAGVLTSMSAEETLSLFDAP